MSAVERFIDNNDLTEEEEAALWAQCSGADEYHDVERALADIRQRAAVPTGNRTGTFTGEHYDGADFTGPVLPYGAGRQANSGWSGSSTSQAAAVDQDNDGRTLDKQQEAIWLLGRLCHGGDSDPTALGRGHGLTWRELDERTQWGHGSTSRVLSDLHKAGLIARLTEERGRCKVYVLPEYVNGRETEPHGGRGGDRLTPEERGVVEAVRIFLEDGFISLSASKARTMLAAIDRLAPPQKDKTDD